MPNKHFSSAKKLHIVKKALAAKTMRIIAE